MEAPILTQAEDGVNSLRLVCPNNPGDVICLRDRPMFTFCRRCLSSSLLGSYLMVVYLVIGHLGIEKNQTSEVSHVF